MLVEVDQPIAEAFFIRESDDDIHLLEGMLQQTLGRYRDRPGVAQALELGMAPYLQPDEIDGVMAMRGKGYRAVAYVRHGTLFVLWGGSAAKETSEGDNPFVSYAARLVEAFKIQQLYVSNFSRLVRSQRVQGRLRAALIDARTQVHCGGHVIEMASGHGQLMWDVLAMVYSLERDAIELRLVLGQVYAAVRGQWPNTPPPHGYELVAADGGVKLAVSQDPEEITRTRRMIEALASAGTARQKLDRLGDLGVRMYTNVRGGPVDLPASEVGQPSTSLRTLNDRLEFYRDQRWVYRRVVPPSLGLDEIAGRPVEVDANGQRFIEVNVPVDTPPDGWASKELFEAWDAERRRCHATALGHSGGGRQRSQRKPLTGMCHYRRGDLEYRLTSDGKHAYTLRRRRYDPERTHQGWDGHKPNSELVLKIDAAQLHQRLAEGITAALTDGHSVELSDGVTTVDDHGYADVIFVDDATRRQQTRDRITELEARLNRLAELAADAGDTTLAAAYHQRAKDADAELVELRRRLDQPPSATEVPDTLVVHGRTILTALETLRGVETTTEPEIADAIGTVLADLEIEGDENAVTWRVDVRLPTNRGLAILRGVTGTITTPQRPTRYVHLQHRDDAAEALIESLAAGETTGAIQAAAAQHPVAFGAALLKRALDSIGIPDATRRILLAHPNPAFRQIIVTDALSRHLPDDYDPAYLAAVRHVAADPPPLSLPANRASAASRQRLLDVLDPDTPQSIRDLREAAGLARNQRIPARLGYSAARRTDPTAYRPHQDNPQIASTHPHGFLARRCPRCQAATWRMVKLPELHGALCTHCLTHDEVTYPASYLTWQQDRPLGVAATDHAAKQRARMERIPDGPHTLLDLRNACGAQPEGTNLLKDALANGYLEDLGTDPAHSGPGMPPRRYQLTPAGRRWLGRSDD
ncbi:MAG: hypothetical protein ACQETV_08660 [Actinomycetota bacterium]